MFARKISHQLQANIGSVNTGQIQGVRGQGLNWISVLIGIKQQELACLFALDAEGCPM